MNPVRDTYTSYSQGLQMKDLMYYTKHILVNIRKPKGFLSLTG